MMDIIYLRRNSSARKKYVNDMQTSILSDNNNNI
jgi:hypothetical protein